MTTPRKRRTRKEALPREFETCSLCGKQAELTEAVMDSWYPYVYAINPNGFEEEISPVCDDHTDVLTYDEETTAWLFHRPVPA